MIIRYVPAKPKDPNADDDKLEATNYENSALFLVSCFQYILVAAVFSIGPPFRKHMWTNGNCCMFHLWLARVLIILYASHLPGWFMLSMVCLCLFNVVVLLDPPGPVAKVLELMNLPVTARATLLLAVVINVVTSLAYEHYGTQAVSRVIGLLFELRRRQRVRDGKIYKTVEGGMR